MLAPKNSEMIVIEKRVEQVNGIPIENMEMVAVQKDGKRVIRGNYNGKPFMYTNIRAAKSRKRSKGKTRRARIRRTGRKRQ